MNNIINLNELSDDSKERIMQILEQEQKKSSMTEGQALNAFFAKTRANRGQNSNFPSFADDLKNIEVDNEQAIQEGISKIGMIDGHEMKEKRLNGNLGSHDRETYRQLYMIHENGLVNFWQKVKNVVDKKVDIRMEDVSDRLPRELLD